MVVRRPYSDSRRAIIIVIIIIMKILHLNYSTDEIPHLTVGRHGQVRDTTPLEQIYPTRWRLQLPE